MYRQNRVYNAYSKRTPLLYPVLLMGLKGSLWYYLNHRQSFLKGGPVKILSHQITLVLGRLNVDQFTLAASRWGGARGMSRERRQWMSDVFLEGTAMMECSPF